MQNEIIKNFMNICNVSKTFCTLYFSRYFVLVLRRERKMQRWCPGKRQMARPGRRAGVQT